VREVAAGVADRPLAAARGPARLLSVLQLAQHAADVRLLVAELEEAARLHVLVPDVVHAGARVIHRAQQRVLVGMLRHAREISLIWMPLTLVGMDL